MSAVEERIAVLREQRNRALSRDQVRDIDRRIAVLVKAWRTTGGKLKLVRDSE